MQGYERQTVTCDGKNRRVLVSVLDLDNIALLLRAFTPYAGRTNNVVCSL